jgi:hypothetical protein
MVIFFRINQFCCQVAWPQVDISNLAGQHLSSEDMYWQSLWKATKDLCHSQRIYGSDSHSIMMHHGCGYMALENHQALDGLAQKTRPIWRCLLTTPYNTIFVPYQCV